MQNMKLNMTEATGNETDMTSNWYGWIKKYKSDTMEKMRSCELESLIEVNSDLNVLNKSYVKHQEDI